MMDGQVGVIRAALDAAGHQDVVVLAYSAKYSSAFFGPFREAVASTLQGDRRTYQQDPANRVEGVREALLDVAEGADLVMVKPALAYLDVLAAVREAVDVPVAAYNVSGEYAMVEAAAARGWIDRDAAILESLTAIRRAGADVVLTYWAAEVAALASASRTGPARETARQRDGGPPRSLPTAGTPPPAPRFEAVRALGDNGQVTPRTSSGTTGSADLFVRAQAVTPGGVNSPVRAFSAVGGTPRFMDRAKGPYLTDVDGNRYVDLVGSWGPMLLGHAHPEVLDRGRRGGRPRDVVRHPDRPEVELAEEIVARTPVDRCGSSPPAPRPRCRPSGWPAASPAATWS